MWARRVTTTDGTPTELTGVDRITIRTTTTVLFEIFLTARQTGGIAGTVGDSAMWLITGAIKRDSLGNTALLGVPTGTGTPSAFNDAGAATWDVTVTADNTNEALAITVTGETDKDISWVARVSGPEAR
jgi:hypothetical protein